MKGKAVGLKRTHFRSTNIIQVIFFCNDDYEDDEDGNDAATMVMMMLVERMTKMMRLVLPITKRNMNFSPCQVMLVREGAAGGTLTTLAG